MSTLDSPQMTDPTSVSPRPIGIRYGGIAALLLIVIGLGFHLSGLSDYKNQNNPTNWIATILNWGVMIGAIAMAMKKHRDDLGGYMTYGRGFTVGFWASLIMAIITAVWTYVFFTLVAPDLMGIITDAARENMLKQGQSEEQVDQAMQYTTMFMNPAIFTAFAVIGTLFTGIIISLITAAIVQRKPPMNTTY